MRRGRVGIRVLHGRLWLRWCFTMPPRSSRWRPAVQGRDFLVLCFVVVENDKQTSCEQVGAAVRGQSLIVRDCVR